MKLAVIGCTGLVGTVILKVISECKLPISELILVASLKSTGKVIKFKANSLEIESIEMALSKNPEIAIFSAGGEISKKCGIVSIKIKKPNIILNTRMKMNTFKHLKEELPINIQNKFVFQSEHESEISRVIIRGLGVVDTQMQIENLISWFSIMSISVEKLLKQEIKI